MHVWDYNIPQNWKPKTEEGWTWYLERKINYGDLKGLDPKVIKKYFPLLKLDEGKKQVLEFYFQRYAQ